MESQLKTPRSSGIEGDWLPRSASQRREKPSSDLSGDKAVPSAVDGVFCPLKVIKAVSQKAPMLGSKASGD